MREWLSELNWLGGFGALTGVAIAAIVMRRAAKTPIETSDGEPAK
jgi:hypothetical protein